MKLEKKHWEQAKLDNQNLILQNKLTTQMAETVLIMINEELNLFPKEPEKPKV